MNYYLLDEITIPGKRIEFFEEHGTFGPYSWVEPINTVVYSSFYVSLIGLIAIFILRKIFKKHVPNFIRIILILALIISFHMMVVPWIIC